MQVYLNFILRLEERESEPIVMQILWLRGRSTLLRVTN
jgi:hypothetical protein